MQGPDAENEDSPDGQLGELRGGHLDKVSLTAPTGSVKWLFDNNTMSELFVLVRWGRAA